MDVDINAGITTIFVVNYDERYPKRQQKLQANY